MAKKSRAFAELLASDRSANNLRKKVNRHNPNIQLVESQAGTEKMSEILESFLEPYTDSSCDRQTLHMMFSLGVVAWNMSLLPKEKREEALAATFSKMKSVEEMDEAKDLFRELIERKDRFFARHQRWIVEFDLQYVARGDYHIAVASTTEPVPFDGI